MNRGGYFFSSCLTPIIFIEHYIYFYFLRLFSARCKDNVNIGDYGFFYHTCCINIYSERYYFDISTGRRRRLVKGQTGLYAKICLCKQG